MKDQFRLILLVLFVCLAVSMQAQEHVVDIVTLKNDKGVIKGFIAEQVPGETVKILPSSAVLKIDFEDISGVLFRKSLKKDTATYELDVVTLKDGTAIEGSIAEQSPGKWLVIETKSLSPRTYRYDEIEKIGKETSNKEDDIFKAYGLLDVLYLKDQSLVKGIIIEQSLGESLKMQTKIGIVVYDIADVIRTGKEPYDATKDLFKQSAFLDVVVLKNGSSLKGIIYEQIPGKSLRIETVGNSSFIQAMSEVIKICKEKNLLKEEHVADSQVKKVPEPKEVGDCYWIRGNSITRTIEKQTFVKGNKTDGLLLIDGTAKSPIRIKAGSEIVFRVKTSNNNIDPQKQIYIILTKTDKRTNKRSINSREHSFLSSQANPSKVPGYPQYEATKTGDSSFDLKLKINIPGEYAIYVSGCDKSFSLFGIDEVKTIKK
ncbi:MAG: hypothetical protein AB2L20_08245 [Mangrovibacterium sp.]